MLIDKLPNITAKPFSVGFRMEHSQQEIDTALYGSFAKQLPHAEYQFSTHINKQQNQAVYTFCMCPGGQVINASSEPGKLVTNGMSLHARGRKKCECSIISNGSVFYGRCRHCVPRPIGTTRLAGSKWSCTYYVGKKIF